MSIAYTSLSISSVSPVGGVYRVGQSVTYSVSASGVISSSEAQTVSSTIKNVYTISGSGNTQASITLSKKLSKGNNSAVPSTPGIVHTFTTAGITAMYAYLRSTCTTNGATVTTNMATYNFGTLTVLAKPQVAQLSLQRCNSYGIPSDQGTYCLITALIKGSTLDSNGLLAPTVAVDSTTRSVTWYSGWSSTRGVYSEISFPLSSTAQTMYAVVSGISTVYDYTITVTARDNTAGSGTVYTGTSLSANVSGGSATPFDIRQGNDGVTIGGNATESGFHCLWNAEFSGTVDVSSNLDVAGALSVGSDSYGNPNASISSAGAIDCTALTVNGSSVATPTFGFTTVTWTLSQSYSAGEEISFTTKTSTLSGYTPLGIVGINSTSYRMIINPYISASSLGSATISASGSAGGGTVVSGRTVTVTILWVKLS